MNENVGTSAGIAVSNDNEMETATAAASAPDADKKLIAAFLAGDRSAFNRLVLKHQNIIFGFCARLLGNKQDGEDAAQETFVKVYNNLHTFKGNAHFSTWLYRIAVNTCRNKQRSFWNKFRKKAVAFDPGADDEEYWIVKELEDTSMTPVKELNRRRMGTALSRAIAGLPHQQREIVVMRDIKDMSYEQIAHITRVPQGTVKSRLNRARAVLREALKEYAHD
ncbi:MAG: sigma-70 family RNA polymerase sigma factor [Chitinivibrionales bacterium]|nr:sigma-70 family RNA polymerase sigma factor [Chitinivibrionales bacterium]